MSALVQLTDVSKRYDGAAALQPTDLSIERGKTTVLIGPSGCGKSTLLRLIIRLIEPESGTIEFDGAPIAPDKIDILRRRIGYVIQEGGLFPASDGTRKCSAHGETSRKSRKRIAATPRGIVCAHEILRKLARPLSGRTFWRATSAREFDARVNAVAGAVAAR